MSTERQCLFKKKNSPRAKGCQNEAKYRVILGKGYFIDVCELHVGEYKMLGLKIVLLKESEQVLT
jgi:hypothetical protein